MRPGGGPELIAGATFPPAFGLDGAVKDSGLIIVTTQEAGIDPVLMAAVLIQVRGCSLL